MLPRRTVLASTVLLPVQAAAQALNERSPSRIVGAWSLIDAVAFSSEGKASPWRKMQAPLSGLIVYDLAGMMSVQISGSRQPLSQDADFLALPDMQQLPYLHSYYAYFGRYIFDPVHSTITHFVTSALDPSEIGRTYLRSVQIRGDTVTLTTPKSAKGLYNVLRWRRTASQSQPR